MGKYMNPQRNVSAGTNDVELINIMSSRCSVAARPEPPQAADVRPPQAAEAWTPQPWTEGRDWGREARSQIHPPTRSWLDEGEEVEMARTDFHAATGGWATPLAAVDIPWDELETVLGRPNIRRHPDGFYVNELLQKVEALGKPFSNRQLSKPSC